jgi:hypothetical protein
VKENFVRSHVTELKGQADLGAKPKSVQPIHGEVYRDNGQPRENPVLKHVNELQRQASLKGEPAPFQPIPEEQQATERLGKPPPELEVKTVLIFLGDVQSLLEHSGTGEQLTSQELEPQENQLPETLSFGHSHPERGFLRKLRSKRPRSQ